MKIDLEKKLVKRFKFLQRDKDDMTPYYLFGIECENGWENLLYRLFEGIEKILEQDSDFRIMQIKEKFGSLRVYTNFSNDLIDTLINKAELESEKICEDCGKKGKLVKLNGWLRTQCQKCFKEWKKEQKERLK
jgi:hypothetical protein